MVQDSPHTEGCTPSKIRKLSSTPQESPSDKRSARDKRKKLPAAKSIKFGFTTPAKNDQGIETELTTPEIIKKVYVAKDSFETERLENKSVGNFFLCRICGNFPRVTKVNMRCFHFYCVLCIDNFQASYPTSKCPYISPEGEICKFQTTQLYDLDGFLYDIHSSIRLLCRNLHCEDYIPLRDIADHEKNCKKKATYSRKQESLSKSRSKKILGSAEAQLNTLTEWCQKNKVNPCDFMLYALTKNIKSEVPALERSVQDLFKQYLEQKEGDPEEKITPIMALALKLEINLSHRQYCKLSSKKLLGKLPYIAQVRKVADQLDPGNVLYETLLKSTGEIIGHHEAVPKSGIINASKDIGNMSFGDLNVNFHGYRATLSDSIAKMFEEAYAEISLELEKNEAASEDPNRQLKLFTKVAFDGTSAPLKSEKGSSRVPPGSWLRGTVCLVAVQVTRSTFLTYEIEVYIFSKS